MLSKNARERKHLNRKKRVIMNEKTIMKKHLGQLIGRKVTGLVIDPSHDMGSICGLQLDNGLVAFILCDPEGNGPGYLEIQKGE